jgi:hypothetical protein
MQPPSSHLFSARAEISLPAHNLFLKNNQLDGLSEEKRLSGLEQCLTRRLAIGR